MSQTTGNPQQPKSKHGRILGLLILLFVAIILGAAYMLRDRLPKPPSAPQKAAAPSVTVVGASEPKAFVAQFLGAYQAGQKDQVNALVGEIPKQDAAFDKKDGYYELCSATEACNEVLKNASFKADDPAVQVVEFSAPDGATGKTVRFTAKQGAVSKLYDINITPNGASWLFHSFSYETAEDMVTAN